MLIKYKKPYEKSAMGLLSFMNSEKDMKLLQQTMRQYEENPSWQLYLWKQKENFTGLIGIEVDEQCFRVLHISVNPSFRDEGIGHAMVDEIQKILDPHAMCATVGTRNFLSHCWKKCHPFSPQ